MNEDDPYLIPGTGTLRNKLGLIDQKQLDRAERRIVTLRLLMGEIPTGSFDLLHLQAIHRYLFGEIYEWAGELRTVEMSKDGSQFQLHAYIRNGVADVHRRLVEKKFLAGLSMKEFAEAAGEIIGDINYVHPFREGNGRAQLQYLKQLASRAGHGIDLERLDTAQWMRASREAHKANYEPMTRCIERAIAGRLPR